MESSNFSKVQKVFWHIEEIQIKRKLEVTKAATYVLRQEHNAGSIIHAFLKKVSDASSTRLS